MAEEHYWLISGYKIAEKIPQSTENVNFYDLHSIINNNLVQIENAVRNMKGQKALQASIKSDLKKTFLFLLQSLDEITAMCRQNEKKILNGV